MVIRQLSPSLQDVASKELFESPERISKDLDYIRDWLKRQPHLKVRADDQSLLIFLRGCKFSLQRTQEKLDYYYTARTILTEFFSNRDPFNSDIQEVLKIGCILPLPSTEGPGGPRIVLLRFAGLNPDKIHYVLYHKVYFMILDILAQEDDNFIVSGLKVWADLKNAPVRYAVQQTPSLVKSINEYVQKGFPLRLKGVYLTHSPSIAETLLNIYKSFSSQKLGKRMFLYSENSHEELCKQIPKHLHPKEFGGENGSLKELTECWVKKVESYRDWFLEDAGYGTIEELRVGTPKTSANMFGVEGTFRKLNID